MDYFPLNIKAFQNKKKSKITIFNNKQQSLNHQKNNNFNKNKNTCILNTSNSRHNMFDEKKLIHVFKSRYCLNTLSKKFQIYIYKKKQKQKNLILI